MVLQNVATEIDGNSFTYLDLHSVMEEIMYETYLLEKVFASRCQ